MQVSHVRSPEKLSMSTNGSDAALRPFSGPGLLKISRWTGLGGGLSKQRMKSVSCGASKGYRKQYIEYPNISKCFQEFLDTI